jgi:glycosyltransferase involved in cell wall biosynthesis
MRILMVNDMSPATGAGAEGYLRRLAEELRARGDEVEVFWPRAAHAGPAKVFDLWDPFVRRQLRRRASEFVPDVVHHHNILREASVAVLGVPRSVPCVMTLHDHRILGRADHPARTVLDHLKVAKTIVDRWWARRRLRAVMAVSDELVDAARNAGFRDVRRVRVFAADPGDAGDPVDRCRDVVFVGRVTADKGADVLLSAFAVVADARPDVRLVIVGDGAELPALRGQAIALGIDAHFCGWLAHDEVVGVLRKARVVVIPSRPALRREGMPMVAIEAALLARPLVVSDDPGLREFVDAAGCGLAVAPEDVDELASAIGTLLDDAELSTAFGVHARTFAIAHHTPAPAVTTVRGVYESVLA